MLVLKLLKCNRVNTERVKSWNLFEKKNIYQMSIRVLSAAEVIIFIQFITLKNNWTNPYVKTKGKCNESVNNEFKIMRKSNSLHQIIRVSKNEPKSVISFYSSHARGKSRIDFHTQCVIMMQITWSSTIYYIRHFQIFNKIYSSLKYFKCP